jgi:hypothetical protein
MLHSSQIRNIPLGLMSSGMWCWVNGSPCLIDLQCLYLQGQAVFSLLRVLALPSKILQASTHCSTWQLTKKTRGTTHKQKQNNMCSHQWNRMNHKKVKNRRPKRHSKIITAVRKTSHTNPESNSIKSLIKPPWYIPRHYTLHYEQYN